MHLSSPTGHLFNVSSQWQAPHVKHITLFSLKKSLNLV